MSPKSPIADTYGPIYLGAMLAGVLYGITVVQTYIYLIRYSKDRSAIKLFVVSIFLLDTVHQASITWALWHYFIDSFAIPTNYLLIHYSLDIYFVISILIGFLVQIFYTYRIWNLTRNGFVCAAIIILAFVHLGFGTYFGGTVFKIGLWTEAQQYSWLTDVSLSCSSAADILIAVAMTIILRSRTTEYDRTRSIVQKLIAYTVGTGALTVLMSMTIVITFATAHEFIAQGLFFTLAKVYTNSALISLNARESIRNGIRRPQGSSISRSTELRASDARHHHDQGMKYPPIVHIHRTIATDYLETTTGASREQKWESHDNLEPRVV